MQYWGVGPYGDGAYEAVDQLADGFTAPAAGAVERRRLFVVRALRRNSRHPGQQSTKVAEVPFVSGTGENLHPDRVTGGDIVVEEIVDSGAYRTTGVA